MPLCSRLNQNSFTGRVGDVNTTHDTELVLAQTSIRNKNIKITKNHY